MWHGAQGARVLFESLRVNQPLSVTDASGSPSFGASKLERQRVPVQIVHPQLLIRSATRLLTSAVSRPLCPRRAPPQTCLPASLPPSRWPQLSSEWKPAVSPCCLPYQANQCKAPRANPTPVLAPSLILNCGGIVCDRTAYYKRLVEASKTLAIPVTKIQNMTLDGIYIHKRPLRSPSGQSPLAVCGSVYHHALIYIKEGEKVHCLDFGPANGCDVTANIMEAAPGRKVLSANMSMADVAQEQSQGDGCPLPYLYCGEVLEGLHSATVQQAIQFIESGSYHAIGRNCIHACDLLLRCLTRGQLRSGPMLYDVLAGEVPTVESPLVMMMQMMLGRSWMDVCDGSALTREAAPMLGWARAATGKQQVCARDNTVDSASAAAVVALAKAAMSAAGIAAAMPPGADSEHGAISAESN